MAWHDMKRRILGSRSAAVAAVVAGLTLAAGAVADSGGQRGLGTVIQDAAALQPMYGFAADCAASGALGEGELTQFRVRLLDALTEKHGLTVEGRLVAQAYLLGDAQAVGGADGSTVIVPASGGQRDTRSCDSATKLM